MEQPLRDPLARKLATYADLTPGDLLDLEEWAAK
jgi:hypothetical protein